MPSQEDVGKKTDSRMVSGAYRPRGTIHRMFLGRTELVPSCANAPVQVVELHLQYCLDDVQSDANDDVDDNEGWCGCVEYDLMDDERMQE